MHEFGGGLEDAAAFRILAMPKKAPATARTSAAGTRGEAISARSLNGSELHSTRKDLFSRPW
jgi:hypothetical protein